MIGYNFEKNTAVAPVTTCDAYIFTRRSLFCSDFNWLDKDLQGSLEKK